MRSSFPFPPAAQHRSAAAARQQPVAASAPVVALPPSLGARLSPESAAHLHPCAGAAVWYSISGRGPAGRADRATRSATDDGGGIASGMGVALLMMATAAAVTALQPPRIGVFPVSSDDQLVAYQEWVEQWGAKTFILPKQASAREAQRLFESMDGMLLPGVPVKVLLDAESEGSSAPAALARTLLNKAIASSKVCARSGVASSLTRPSSFLPLPTQ
jgi:hypothetical protein